MKKRKNMDGQIFNSLQIICDYDDFSSPRRVNVKCLNCGNFKDGIILKDIVRGYTKGCGCLRPWETALAKARLNPPTSEAISKGKTDEFTPFKYQLKKIKNSGRKECFVTLQDLKEVWEKQQGKCVYTNITLILPKHSDTFSSIKDFYKASVDRIDSKKPYIKENIQFVSQSINMAKHVMSDSDMKDFISEIIKSHSSN